MTCRVYLDNPHGFTFVTTDPSSGRSYTCYRRFKDLAAEPVLVTQSYRISFNDLASKPCIFEFDTDDTVFIPDHLPEYYI